MAPNFGMMDEFELAQDLCKRLGLGYPQEVRLGESYWVYIQLTLAEAWAIADKLEGKES